MALPDPVEVWAAIAVLLCLSTLAGIYLTAQTLRWVLAVSAPWLEQHERWIVAVGHLLREVLRLVSGVLAVVAALDVWGRPSRWTLLSLLLVWLLSTILLNSLNDHYVRWSLLRVSRRAVALGLEARIGASHSRPPGASS